MHQPFYTNTNEQFVTSDDKNFYVYVSSGMEFDINLYQNTADRLILDKTSYLTAVDTLSGTLRDRCNIIRPTIIIERNSLPTFNYVYIPVFNRYYYLNEFVSVRTNLWEISLILDERMTYKTEILNLKDVIVGRAESSLLYDPYYVDEKIPVTAGKRYTVTEITNTTFSRTESTYPFVVAVVAKSTP